MNSLFNEGLLKLALEHIAGSIKEESSREGGIERFVLYEQPDPELCFHRLKVFASGEAYDAGDNPEYILGLRYFEEEPGKYFIQVSGNFMPRTRIINERLDQLFRELFFQEGNHKTKRYFEEKRRVISSSGQSAEGFKYSGGSDIEDKKLNDVLMYDSLNGFHPESKDGKKQKKYVMQVNFRIASSNLKELMRHEQLFVLIIEYYILRNFYEKYSTIRTENQ